MSWSANLQCKCCGSVLYDRGYTINTNAMLTTALYAVVPDRLDTWPQTMTGRAGEDAVEILSKIVIEMVTNLEKYQAMNPENGWGDALGLIDVLFAMLKASAQFPDAVWRVFN